MNPFISILPKSGALVFWALSVMAATLPLSAKPATDGPAPFTLNQKFLTPPGGMATIGDSHGDIAVSPNGEIYVSVEGGPYKGVQVYSAAGHYLRNVPNAPSDLHGFIIAPASDGTPNIFGARLGAQQVVQLTLEGKPVLTIPATSIPEKYKTIYGETRDGDKPAVSLTGVAVAPNGDIYAVDGYGLDFIHRFDKKGRYKGTFGGRGAPWNFGTCHKIIFDPRFHPVRLLCTDRSHDRIVQMDLEGNVLGVLATGLRAPSAMAVYGNELAVAELKGRVSVLNLQGQVIASIGTNENPKERENYEMPPERWQPDLFYAPHGIAYDSAGNLLETEWNQWGRVVLLTRQ